MQPEGFLASAMVALPFFLLAAILYAIASWKKRQGIGLHVDAQRLLDIGDEEAGRNVLLQALWSANEEPSIERQILRDLRNLYSRSGVDFQTDDYEVLISQFERLSRKGSHKAWSELKKVQVLKSELIDRMPKVA